VKRANVKSVLLIRLFKKLKKIEYVSWKSNQHLESAFVGKTDFDLLVSAKQKKTFTQILLEEGFVILSSGKSKKASNVVQHFLGYDPAYGNLCHIHVQYQLVLGERYIKNYRLPLEQVLFRTHVVHPTGLKLARPTWELTLLVIRILLKARFRDVFFSFLGRQLIPSQMNDELRFLAQQVNDRDFKDHVDKLGKGFAGYEVYEFFRRWKSGTVSRSQFVRLKYRVKSALSRFRRTRGLRAAITYRARSIESTLRALRILSPADKKTLDSGGISIALIGPDGAGKSTLVRDLSKWLGWKLQTHVLYMGSQRPSFLTELILWPFRFMRYINKVLSRQYNHRFFRSGVLVQFEKILEHVYFGLIARDRFTRFKRGKAFMQNGTVVLFDRYPYEPLYSAMDGPRIKKGAGFLNSKLYRIEARSYKRIKLPDVVIILYVAPKVAQRRKPEHSLKMLSVKASATASVKAKPGRGVQVVDANRSYAHVLGKIKSIVWHAVSR
jgi:thymidylate kinase